MSKAKILESLTSALRENPLKNEKATYSDIIIPVEQNQIEEYKRLQQFNKAEVYDIQENQIQQTLEEIFHKENITQILTSSTLQNRLSLTIPTQAYDQSMEELKDILFKIECGLLEADYGVANLGVMAFTSSKLQPRLLSLITKYCIVLVRKDKIVNNLSEAIKNIQNTHPDTLPSNIIFVAGPSRTADIELQVVFGVHGPQKVYVLLY